MKKLFILILTVLTVFLAQGSAMAVSVYEDALFDISSLGIFIPNENGGYNEDRPLTRAEFATAILRVIGYDEVASESKFPSFSDVKKDAWYYDAVENIHSLNIMTGDGNGCFHPNANVTLEEAVKTVVVILGYDLSAQKQGGWPHGYMATATKLGVLDALRTSGTFTRGDLAVILYNALDVEILVQSYGTQDFYRDGDTYRYILMRMRGSKMYNLIDVVKATAFSYTEFPIKDLDDDEVVIGTVRYKKGKTNAEKYLGMEVEIFAAENPDGTTTLLSVRPTGKNTVTEVLLTDIDGCNSSYVNYTYENKAEKLSFEALPVMLYNGTPITFDTGELLSQKAGYVKFIDCDSDNKVEYIFIEAYENMLVQRVSEYVIVPYNGFSVNGKKTLFVDLENEDKKFEFFDENGNAAQFADILPEHLISVYSDKNETRFKIYFSTQKQTGAFVEIGDNSVKIDENEYNTYSQTVFNAELGDNVTAYIDAKGNCAYIKYLPQTKNYGYIIGAGRKGLSTNQVKMILSKPASFTADVNSEDIDNITSTPVLICENEGIEIFNLASRVEVNGSKYSANDALVLLQSAGAVKYSLNQEGLLREAEILDMYAGDSSQKLQYNVYDKVFAGNNFVNGFALDEKSNIICIPETVKSDEDYLVKTRIDVSGNTEGYTVRAYDFEEETKRAGLVVVVKGMDAELVNDAKITSSVACMIKKVSVICTEDGEFYRLTLIENGKEVTYDTIQLKSENSVISTLRKGDLISYYMNDSDLIENVMLFHSFENGDGSYKIQHATRDYVEYCGVVEDISFDEIDNANCLLATKVIMDIQGGSVPLYIQQRNKPPVFIFDFEESDRAFSSTLEEIIPGHDKIYVLSVSNKTPRACVIIRGE